MKTSPSAQLAVLIVKESFGECVADVTNFIVCRHKSPLRVIAAETKLPLKQVRLCLTVGIQHQFIIVSQHKRGYNEYSANLDAIIHRLRYPSYVYCIKMLYGNVSEVLVEEILQHGLILHSQLISKALQKLRRNVKENVSESEAYEKLQLLVNTRFVEVCEEDSTDNATDSSTEPPPSKRQKTEATASEKWYRVCAARFNYYCRDMMMVEAVTRKLGPKHGEILSTMLRLSEVKTDPSATESAPISSNEIFNTLPQHLAITSRNLLDAYMMTLTDDPLKLIVKFGDDGGGSYLINYREAVTSLCKASMEALVLERFGSKSLRLFRLLLMKQHLEQKQLEEMAMVPARDAKQLLYTMMSHNFVSTTEISKTADHAPSRTFYCFKVPVEQLARQLQDHNYKSILNLMTKRLQILSENRRLLEKQQKVEAIIATLSGADEEQKEEIQEMITPAERLQLKTVKQQTDRLENGELQLADTTLIWEMYLTYQTFKRINEIPQAKRGAR